MTPDHEAVKEALAAADGQFSTPTHCLDLVVLAAEVRRLQSENEELKLEVDEALHDAAEAERKLAVAVEALEELLDHHCGGVCSEGEEARGYKSHSAVMKIVEDALSQLRSQKENTTKEG